MGRDSRRTRLVLAVLLLTSVTLISVDVRATGRSPLDPVRDVVASAFGPVEEAAATVVRPVAGVVDDVRNLRGNQERIAELERDRDALRLQLRTSEHARARAGQLDKLLRLASVGQYRVVPAQVVAIGPAQGFAWTVTIDAGTRDGVRTDMTVVNGDGLVGRVKSVGTSTATVLLAADATARVGIRLERTLEVGVATGRGPDILDVELLQPQAALKTGDRFVTFGSSGGAPFVAGVPVGEVVAVRSTVGALTKRATVRPFVDFTALDLVAVVVEPPRSDPRDKVLPPRPSAAPSKAAPSKRAPSKTAPSKAAPRASTRPRPAPTPSG
jgi:rod shape-determining protein MreC